MNLRQQIARELLRQQRPRRKTDNGKRINLGAKPRITKGLDQWLWETPSSSLPAYLEKLKVLSPVISKVERLGIFKIYVI